MARKTPEDRGIVQVLLALDAAGQYATSMESAVAIAARLQAELLGLFIEDADLLRSASLPFSQEVCLSTGEFRALGAGDLERSLRSLARQAERSLSEAAERARVPWSFRTVRGHRLQAALAPNGNVHEMRLVVLGRSRPVRGAPDARPAGQAVYVLDDAGEAARKAVAVAGRMLQGEPGEVLVLTSDAAAVAVDVEGLNVQGVPARARGLEADDLMALLSAMGDPPPRVLLLPATHALVGDARSLEALLKRVDFPVIVVS